MNYRFMAIHITTQCTLNCKLCAVSYPKFQPPRHSDTGVIVASLEKVFQILDSTEELRIAGAEAFLHPYIDEIIKEAAKYKEQFEFINIVTNGTYIPKAKTLETIAKQNCKIVVRIDNYGELSKCFNELTAQLEKYEIAYEVRDNYGDNLFCNGWIDFGTEYEYKGYSDEQLGEIFERCNNRICPIVWDGVWYACSFYSSGHLLGKIPMNKRDYVNLLSGISIDEMKQIVEEFPREPYLGCQYCNGFDVERSERLPAAEQIKSV